MTSAVTPAPQEAQLPSRSSSSAFLFVGHPEIDRSACSLKWTHSQIRQSGEGHTKIKKYLDAIFNFWLLGVSIQIHI